LKAVQFIRYRKKVPLRKTFKKFSLTFITKWGYLKLMVTIWKKKISRFFYLKKIGQKGKIR
jgi:hypothetical protein